MAYPVLLVGLRVAVQRLFERNVLDKPTSNSFPVYLIGVTSLLMKIFTATPQYYVLVMCVAGLAARSALQPPRANVLD